MKIPFGNDPHLARAGRGGMGYRCQSGIKSGQKRAFPMLQNGSAQGGCDGVRDLSRFEAVVARLRHLFSFGAYGFFVMPRLDFFVMPGLDPGIQRRLAQAGKSAGLPDQGRQ
jgi:hypothetical protein